MSLKFGYEYFLQEAKNDLRFNDVKKKMPYR